MTVENEHGDSCQCHDCRLNTTDDHAYASAVFGALLRLVPRSRALVLADRYDSAIAIAWRIGDDPATVARAIVETNDDEMSYAESHRWADEQDEFLNGPADQ